MPQGVQNSEDVFYKIIACSDLEIGYDLLPIKTIHLAASTMDGFHGDTSNKKHVRVKATTPKIINMSVASHSWGKSGVTQTSG